MMITLVKIVKEKKQEMGEAKAVLQQQPSL